MSGSIYKIVCRPTAQIYIGQTCDKKTRLGKEYNYGPFGRWSDHVSSAKTTNTPLAKAIRQYGKENFIVEMLECGLLEQLDELEAKWIQYYNSLVPNGLNVARHSRNKHHTNSMLQNHFRKVVQSAVLRPIRRNGQYSLVYLNLYLKDGTTRRISFGQDTEDSFETAKNKAVEFVQNIGCPWTEEIQKSTKLNERYATKLKQFEGKVLTKIRITTASSLIALYISTEETKSHKEQVRICFGGKTMSYEEAYLTALDFIEELNPNPDIIEDFIHQSPQQVAAE